MAVAAPRKAMLRLLATAEQVGLQCLATVACASTRAAVLRRRTRRRGDIIHPGGGAAGPQRLANVARAVRYRAERSPATLG